MRFFGVEQAFLRLERSTRKGAVGPLPVASGAARLPVGPRTVCGGRRSGLLSRLEGRRPEGGRALKRNPRARETRAGAFVVVLAALAAAVLVLVPGALGGHVTGAAFTTVNEGVDLAGHCQNGNPLVNCNIYDGKEYVWLNGGPSVAYLGDGSYFFAVLDPGGQHDPLDGAASNLSDGPTGDP